MIFLVDVAVVGVVAAIVLVSVVAVLLLGLGVCATRLL